jgi:hypothetical protein
MTRESEMTNESTSSVWLVERGQSMQQVPTVWWTGTDWTTEASRALAFKDREQADAYIDARSGFAVPSHGSRFGVAVEHVFVEADADRPIPIEAASQAPLGLGA